MKSFSANLTAALPASPATAFISGAGHHEPEGKSGGSAVAPATAAAKSAQGGGSDVRETKSARVQLLMRPSLVARLKSLAAAKGMSLNELANMELSKL